MSEPDLWIIGAGGLARGVVDIAEETGQKIAGLVTSDHSSAAWFNGPVITEAGFFKSQSSGRAVVAIGDNARRMTVVSQIMNARPAISLPNMVHPDATVARSAVIETGVIIFSRVVIAPYARVCSHALLYSGSIVEHDCFVGSFASFGPAATLGGNVRIGEASFIGLGAKVAHGRSIGRDTVIGAGSVVINDIPDCSVAVGSPCRVIKSRDHGDKYL